ncbi:MAG: thiamine phosphate synthase [Alphaproteobacteria bacterium]|nr:MAG: thiamine phosphate synthase [Alphaproteobacteria bacterium]
MLVAPAVAGGEHLLDAALAGGDVASVIIAPGDLDAAAYQQSCERLVPIAQHHGAAALACDDSRIMGRSGADGVLLTQPGSDLKDIIAQLSPNRIVGCAGARDRHRALEIGECDPDFLFFGRLDGDIRPQPHPKNLALAQWWSAMIEIPCVVMGGSAVDSVVECAASGAEFVALGLAVFTAIDGPEAAVRQANLLLDEHAPIFAEN